jgi:dipeptidyl aminopeptidase/acylaminoacyl peptidase
VILAGAAAAEEPAKRPLRHSDYDGWRSIQAPQLSRDGQYLAYLLTPQDGDGDLVVRNLTTGAERRFPIGSQAPSQFGARAQAGPRAAEALASLRASRLTFTADGKAVVFQIAPSKAETEKARKAKKRPEEMPKNGLGILDLATGAVHRIDRVKNFQVPEEGSGFIAYLKEPRVEEKRPETPPAAPTAPGRRPPRRKEYGTDLALHRLADHKEQVFADALEYSLSKDGGCLVFAVAARQEERNGLYAVTPGGEATPVALLGGRGRYTKLTWDEKQTQVAFLSDRDDAAAAQPKFKLYLGERKTPVAANAAGSRAAVPALGAPPLSLSWALPMLRVLQTTLAVELVSPTTPGFRPGLVISDRGPLTFSRDGARLFLGVAPPPEPEKTDDGAAADDKVVVDLWHWKDDYVQPMQKARAEQERGRSFRAVFHLKEKKFQQLADESLPEAQPSSDGRWALAANDRPYRHLVDFDTQYADWFLVDTADGARKPLLRKQQWGGAWSPDGRFALFYDGKDWNSVAVPDGRVTNLTRGLGVKLGQEEYDMPSVPPAYGIAGWTTADQHVLIYDRYDIWQVAPDGSGARNLTHGVGRKKKLQFRYVRLDPQEKAIDPAHPLLLRAESERTRATGFFRARVDGDAPEQLVMADRNFGLLSKAKNADVYLLTASTFYDFPDLHLTGPDFRELRKVSDANPQKANLLWGRAELVRYRNVDGKSLSGILIKPENFDPQKQYPMVVYIYERLSQGLHQFVNPQPGTSINFAYYASNGYLVLLPDIVYTVGYPGQSALKCVLPAIQAVVDKGFVDENAIGIQGHSWGGYQIAYMITQTQRFKAASAGAPVANMTSAYSGIRWGPGLPRQWQYERSQSRIGGSLWQYPMRFVENSPVFMADRVQTPLLMLHNDADDAVPWYQGIEYFLALRRLGKEVYLFNYNGELHGLRKRANQKDYTVRMQQFFDHHLKGAAKPEWMEKGIPYLEREKEKERVGALGN